MAVIPDVDSYVTTAEADTYFAAHFGYDQWETLSLDQKDQALRSATVKLDLLCAWLGDKCDPSQPLEFPRTEPDSYGCTVPQKVKDAQCEIAYLIVLEGTAVAQTEDVLTKLKAGSVELNFAGDVTPSTDPYSSGLVEDLLKEFGFCQSEAGSTSIIPILRS